MIPDSVQNIFSKFKITECLKKDEHTAVYAGTDIKSGKKLIFKILDTENLPDATILERFKREAKILSQFSHPNIINVMDYGVEDKIFYLLVEYFNGQNLRTFARSRELNDAQKKNIVIQLFRGLAYAHENKVVHRDIKPENILISDKLQLKIVDFGLAQGFTDNFVTTQNAILGTPGYMSPEQIIGDKLTEQSDLFSAGIVIYELYRGKNPFLGSDINETINNIVLFSEESDLINLEGLPEDIVKIIKGLLVKEKTKRLLTAEDVLKILGDEQKVKLPALRKNKHTIIYRGSAAVVILFILILLYKYYPGVFSSNKPDSLNKTESKDTLLISFNKNLNPSQKPVTENKTDNKTTEKPDEKTKEEINREIPDNFKEKKKGEIFVEVIPWADVYIDEMKVETTPLKNPILVEEGEHSLKLVHPNFPVYNSKVSIFPEKRTFTKVNLDTLFGYLDCKVFPWSEIYVNGEFKGETPLQKPIKLIPGNYKIVLKNKKYESAEFNVKIMQNQTFSLKHNFEHNN